MAQYPLLSFLKVFFILWMAVLFIYKYSICRDENIRYIRRYISDISDISVGPIYHGNIRYMSHARVSLIFR